MGDGSMRPPEGMSMDFIPSGLFSGLFGQLLVVWLLLLVVSFFLKPLRKIVWMPVSWLFLAMTPLVKLFTKVLEFMVGIPFIKELVNKIASSDRVTDKLMNFLVGKKLNEETRREAALAKYPEETYSFLYRNVQEGAEMSQVIDGVALTGEDITVFTPHSISKESFRQILKNSIAAGIAVFALMAIVWHPAWLFTSNMTPVKLHPTSIAQLTPPVADSFADWRTVEKKVAPLEQATIIKIGASVAEDFVPSVWGVQTWLFAALFFFLAAINKYVNNVLYAGSQAYLHPLKEKHGRREYRASIVSNFITAHTRLLEKMNEYDQTRRIKLGTGTGIMAGKGKLAAWQIMQAVSASLQDLTLHLAIFGGTGSGKTRTLLTPIIKQFQRIGVGLFLLDGKGVLWQELDGDDNAVIIGRDFSVNLMTGLDPHEIGSIVASISKQVSGSVGADEDFFKITASTLTTKAALIAEVYELTETGRIGVEESCRRWYSPAGLNKLIQNEAEMTKAVAAVQNEIDNNWDWIGAEITEATLVAMEFWNSDMWINLAAETKTGLLTNVDEIIGKIGLDWRMADMSNGNTDYTMREVVESQFNVGIAIDATSGDGAKFALIALKSLFFKTKMDLQKEGKVHLTAFIGDEYQDIISVGSGFTDSTWHNKSRSTGTMSIVCTQSLSTYNSAIGKPHTENFIQNFRNMIALPTEDSATVELITQRIGEGTRAYTSTKDMFESYASMIAAKGLPDIWKMDAVKLPESHEVPPLLTALGAMGGSLRGISIPTERAAVVMPDIQHYKTRGNGAASGNASMALNHIYRKMDKEEAMRTQGNERQPYFSVSDFELGDSFGAAIINVGGIKRVDMIDVYGNTENPYMNESPALNEVTQAAIEVANEVLTEAQVTSLEAPKKVLEHEAV